MKGARSSATRWLVLGAISAGLSYMWVSPGTVKAQSKGNNAVYNNAGGGPVASTAFVDVSAFDTVATDDICTKMHGALASIPKGGTLVDARGINISNSANDGSGHLTCSSNPWNGISKPSKALLPTGTIIITTSWILPDQTQVFGEGSSQTILQASTSFISPMMLMGAACPNAGGTSTFAEHIGHLTLDARGQQIDGIDNCSSQEQSYVDDVIFHGITGTGSGLLIGNGAGHSGPYTNIVFDCSTGCGTQSGTCVTLPATTSGPPQPQPRGFHGLNCIGNNGLNPAIFLDGSDVSLENVTISAFSDGVLIGSGNPTVPVENDLLFNITGSSNHSLIHIASQTSSNVVNNLTLLGITSTGNTFTVEDEVTNTNLSDTNLGMYVLGHAVGGGYSRFTTSPNETTWGIGPAPISSLGKQSCSRNGSLFSSTGTSTTGTLWACVGLNWVKIK
jgi:hypothetical protein